MELELCAGRALSLRGQGSLTEAEHVTVFSFPVWLLCTGWEPGTPCPKGPEERTPTDLMAAIARFLWAPVRQVLSLHL